MVVPVVELPDGFLELLEVVVENIVNICGQVDSVVANDTDDALDALMVLWTYVHHLALSRNYLHRWGFYEAAQKEVLGSFLSSRFTFFHFLLFFPVRSQYRRRVRADALDDTPEIDFLLCILPQIFTFSPTLSFPENLAFLPHAIQGI